MDEYKLSIHALEFCEENGNRHSNVHFDVEHKLIAELYDRYGEQPSIDDLKKIVDRCYAREWLEHAYFGSGRHNGLKITSKGMGVATSKRKSEELRESQKYQSGDMFKCSECGELNDYDSVLVVAKEQGI